jgi:RNA polymerase sigma-70 factor (ECF subfamily)
MAMQRAPGTAAPAGAAPARLAGLPARAIAGEGRGAGEPRAQEPSAAPGVNDCVSGLSVGVEVACRTITLAAEEDAALMARVQRGDRQAFGDLVGRYENAVVNYLTRLTRDRGRAEELAQEAFLRLYERASRYQERGQLLPYVLRIATNLLRSEERRSRRWRTLSQLVGSTPMATPEPSQERRLLSGEATQVVETALSELPLRYRAPLMLREIEGMSYREIAIALGCREGTVKSRINRARERLKTLLEPYWRGRV